MDDFGIDYEYLHECEYGVGTLDTGQTGDCGEPAIVKVWWQVDEDCKPTDAMYVCKEHFDFLMVIEATGDLLDQQLVEIAQRDRERAA